MPHLITTELLTNHNNFYIWGDTNMTHILMGGEGVLDVQGQGGGRISGVDGQWACGGQGS